LREFRSEGKALVVDADALRPASLEAIGKSNAVVTPHAGEFERLFSVKLPAELDKRVIVASEQARKAEVVILLKGPTDVIADGARVGLNETHSPAMTVGGTGDVLAGVTAGLLAKGVAPFEAACAAAFINGSAGVQAVREFGLHITASDVASRIPKVMKEFDRIL
jgi:NAD(P)H-hydrate epimerase